MTGLKKNEKIIITTMTIIIAIIMAFSIITITTTIIIPITTLTIIMDIIMAIIINIPRIIKEIINEDLHINEIFKLNFS